MSISQRMSMRPTHNQNRVVRNCCTGATHVSNQILDVAEVQYRTLAFKLVVTRQAVLLSCCGTRTLYVTLSMNITIIHVDLA